MKRVKRIVGLILVSLFITGCMNINATIEVKEDKSGSVNIVVETDLVEYTKQMMSATNPDVTLSDEDIKNQLKEGMNSQDFDSAGIFSEEDKAEIEKKGYQVETSLDKDNFKLKIIMSRHFNNIDEVSVAEKDILTLKEEDKEKIIFVKTDKNTYKSYNVSIKDTVSSGTNDLENNMSELTKNIKMIYKVSLPSKAISNNATSVSSDNKTLTWDSSIAKANSKIEFEFAFPESKKENNFFRDMSTNKIIAVSLIVGGSLTAIIATIALVISSKKNK